jgi:hypothetical protein
VFLLDKPVGDEAGQRSGSLRILRPNARQLGVRSRCRSQRPQELASGLPVGSGEGGLPLRLVAGRSASFEECALSTQRALRAVRFDAADKGAEFHDGGGSAHRGLWCAWQERERAGAISSAGRRWREREAVHRSGDDPGDVDVDDGGPPTERESRDSCCRVGADAGQRQQTLLITRDVAPELLADLASCLPQSPSPPGVAESSPGRNDVTDRRGSEVVRRRPSRDPLEVARQDPRDRRLLKHDLGDQDLPGRRRCVAPRKVSASVGEPTFDSPGERGHGRLLDVPFEDRRFGEAGQAFTNATCPRLTDTFDGGQVVDPCCQERLQRSEMFDEPIKD